MYALGWYLHMSFEPEKALPKATISCQQLAREQCMFIQGQLGTHRITGSVNFSAACKLLNSCLGLWARQEADAPLYSF